MPWKRYALVVMCLLTITACAHPLEKALEARAAARQQSLLYSGKISDGACDDVGQFIPARSASLTVEASAAPAR